MTTSASAKLAAALQRRTAVKTAQAKPMTPNDLLLRQMQWTRPDVYGPASGLALGGGLVGHALGRDGHWLPRLIEGGLGAGLMYGGYRYASDPNFRQSVNGFASDTWNKVQPIFSDGVSRLFSGFGAQPTQAPKPAPVSAVKSVWNEAKRHALGPLGLA